MSETMSALAETEVLQDIKPRIENKSSMEILSELFSTFDAEPPVIVKKEKDETKKHKKGKKKHKHRKHKKKTKKKQKPDGESASSDSSNSTDDEAVDLSDILIKKEGGITDTLEKIINIKTELPSTLKTVKTSVKIEKTDEKPSKAIKSEPIDTKKSHHKHKKRKREKSEEPVVIKKKKVIASKERQRTSPKSDRSDHKYKEESRKSPKHHSSYDLRNKLEKYHDYDYYKSSKSDHPRDRDKFYKDYAHSKSDNRDDRRHRSGITNSRDRSPNDRWKNRHRNSSRDRHNSNDYIDKKKLLEIARKNAIQMMKSGNLPAALTLGPQAQEKVIAAIKCGGKTVAELTDFCKTLSRKEELGELSSVSEDSDSDTGRPFHHPFIVKDKPLIINIKNSVPLPTKTNHERSTELRLQFPVSSGQQHRTTESEWTPVPVKKPPDPPKPVPAPSQPLNPVANKPISENTPSIAALPPPPPASQNVIATTSAVVPGPQVFPPAICPAPVVSAPAELENIASMVSQRLQAMQKLMHNPNDSQAIGEMYKAQKEMNHWAESKQPVGQFTGSTGVQILSQAQLSSGFQAWARKDQLQTAAPVSGGMGMHLLQKMGWKPGEGLGKDKSGSLEPLLLEVKLDKKGIVAQEENKKKPAKSSAKVTVKTLQGKHPVSLLGEFASKRKLGTPEYVVDFECGPDHKKNFLFKVLLAGVEYKPNVASGNKKEAKAMAATVCLQALGLLPA